MLRPHHSGSDYCNHHSTHLHSLIHPLTNTPIHSYSHSLIHPFIHTPIPIISFQILVEDLFGMPAEEREAGESVARIPESKSPQSLNSYCIMAQFLSPRLLPQLLAPVKEVGNYSYHGTSPTQTSLGQIF